MSPATDDVINLATVRAEEAKRAKIAELDGMLARSDKGVVLGCVSNLIIIFGHDPALAGLLAFDEFTSSPVIMRAAPSPLDDVPPIPGPYPRCWTGADVAHIQSYLQRVWTRQAKRQETEDAMLALATVKRFHPVRDWLDSLVWDGTDRLDGWLSDAFGAPLDRYHAAVGARFLIAAVRRVRQPGCKFDYMPILEGGQGIGKSKTIRNLFSAPWFSDSLPAALQSADAALGLQGAWVVEFGEIEQIIRTEVEIIKAFLSRAVDRFRAPYGRSFQTYPRQSVLIGTTNETGYLRDSSGNRRFWPVQCQFADDAWVAQNRTQLFAEAAAREAAGEDHWLHEADIRDAATIHQADRMMEDVWEDRTNTYVQFLTAVKVPDILSEALSIPVAQQGKREQMRVADILRRNGWTRVVRRDGATISRVWER